MPLFPFPSFIFSFSSDCKKRWSLYSNQNNDVPPLNYCVKEKATTAVSRIQCVMDHLGHSIPIFSVVLNFAILAQLAFYRKLFSQRALWLLKMTRYQCKLWHRELSTSSSLEKQEHYVGQSKEKQKRCCGHIALHINCIFSIKLILLSLLFSYCVLG